ncbi:MAG: DUF6941 family protein [Candidatus Dormibacteria bacterium]
MDQPHIENLILANHVEAVNGLLYVSGGGWTDHWRPAPKPSVPPVISRLGVGVTVIVPWAASGAVYPLEVAIEDSVGNRVANLATQLNSGRPSGLPTGADLRSVLAVSMNVVFPISGDYRVVAKLADQAPRFVNFRVHDVVQAPENQPPVN